MKATTIIYHQGFLSLSLGIFLSINSGVLPAAGSPDYTVNANSIESVRMLFQIPKGSRVTLENVYLEGEPNPRGFDLSRVEIFTPDAKLVGTDSAGIQHIDSPPANIYYRGRVVGDPDSIVALSVEPSGTIRGIVESGQRLWLLSRDEATPIESVLSTGAARLSGHEVSRNGVLAPQQAEGKAEPFACEVKDKPPELRQIEPLSLFSDISQPELAAGQYYEVPIAIETDYEFYTLFNSVSGLQTYVGDLVNYASVIYQRDVTSSFKVNALYYYTANNDPWNSALTDIAARKAEFESFWKANRTAVARATAVFLSGRAPTAGLGSWGCSINGIEQSCLCWPYGGAYSYIGGMKGNFQASNPSIVWDIDALTHEVGHNFGSPHTHAYQNIGGDSNPVDQCFNDATGQITGQLPGLNSLSGGAPGAGTGTIMSYCQLIYPYITNVSLKFGKDHPYGIKAYRVTDLMSARVAKAAVDYPSCITVAGVVNYTLTVTKAGTGSGTVTSNPAGINCGSDCSESYASGTQVTLIATAASGSAFTSWSGCTSSSGATCNVTMTTAKPVTATFTATTPTNYTLTVTKNGTGSGTVTGTGINCGSDCSESYASGAQVTLTAAAASGSTFSGWAGCTSSSGTTCNVTMTTAKTVNATFDLSGGVSGLFSAILPSARSVTVGSPATAFGTIINATGVAVTGCYLALPTSPSIPASFNYQTTNASNQLIGAPNTPANIPIGGSQSFVFGITPSAAFNATNIPIVFDCANTVPAPSQTGLNTFLLSASTAPSPDMVAIGATSSNDGVLRIPSPTGVHAFGTAAVNIGASGVITATADTGDVTLPLTLTLCQTNPSTGACLATPTTSVSSTINTNQSATYAVFARAAGAIAFNPAVNRIFLRLASGGVVRGATSVAVMTEAAANLPDFVVQSISLANNPNYPGYFDAVIMIANNGNLAGYPRVLRIWLNQGTNQACAAAGDYAFNIDNLNGSPTMIQPGYVRTVNITQMPTGAIGNKIFRAFADANCETTEANEQNNQGTFAYTVSSATVKAAHYIVE